MSELESISQEVAARREELIALTQDLIRIPTLNPPGDNYLEICQFVAGWLKPLGFETRLMRAEGAPGDSDAHPRWNLLARREGGHPGPCLHFNSHIDVVEVGRGWTVDPFGGLLRDGKVYGRGACDMKGGLAASMIACAALVALWPDHAGALEVSATADEESGGFGGVAWMAEQGLFDPSRVQHVIIPEPLNKHRICLGHRGVWWAEIETEGHIAHGSMPFLGDCAVRHMGAALREMEDKLFPALAARRTEQPVTPDGARHATLNINALHGGAPEIEGYDGLPAPNVPHSCRMVIDRRVLPEESVDAARAEMKALLDGVAARREGFCYHMRDLFTVDPAITSTEAPVASALARAIQTRLGREAEWVVSPGTYDQKHIDRIGKLKDCVAYGPGVLDLAHQPDEWVGVDDMEDSAVIMALAAVDLLKINQH